MYKIVYSKEAKNNINSLSLKKKRQIKDAIERISKNPDIGKKLTQELKGLSSYRSGDYRIIYRVFQNEILIIVMAVGHRKNIYKTINRKIN